MTSKEFRQLSAAARRQYFRQYRAAWAQAKSAVQTSGRYDMVV